MKTTLLTIGFFVLTATVSYGQEKGSVEAAQRILEYRARLAQQKAEFEKAKTAGEQLFGVDKRWGSEGDFKGTLMGKPPTEFQVGDWGSTSARFEVLNKISKSECLVMAVYKDAEPMLIRGLDTSKVTDGVKFVLQHPVMIQETYSYTSVGGSQKTVLVLESDASKLKEFVAEARKRAWQERWDNEKRTWKDKTGKFSVEAVYDDYLGDGKIRLLREDQSEIIVPLSKLSNSDRLKAIELRKESE